ncbi:hypothetical protein [Veillonella seminalis]|uniref:hypothetical protein n=1 Tax=Veillonella seminalis TaxID=1502943 RepID=UPI0023F0F585|nr:hypothetical protein [Veillonella seminalis]
MTDKTDKTDKTDMTNKEVQQNQQTTANQTTDSTDSNLANFTGMPSLETLWQEQRTKGSDGFYSMYITAAKTAQTIIQNNLDLLMQQAGSLNVAVAEFVEADTAVDQLKERWGFLQKTLEEVANTTRIVKTTLGAYADAAVSVQKLEAGGFTEQYILHRKEELGMQNGDLTKLLVEFSRYAQTLLDALISESKTADLIKKQGNAGDANHKVQIALYQSWLQHAFEVNKILEGRLVFISGLLESLKKDLTTLQVSKMEQDVQERARQVAARRYKAKVEDVTDYDDLEGQYRNRYDEDGNLIGVDEGGTGGNRRGWQVVIVMAAIVLAVIAYFVLKR